MQNLSLKIFSILSFILLTSCNASDTGQQLDESNQLKIQSQQNEDLLFDEHKQDPVNLLFQAYKKSRILLLGHSGHETSQHLYFLSKLLQKIGNDPKLKFIILERPHDNDPLYEKFSLKDPSVVLKTHKFKSQYSQDLSLCGISEWAYTISEFMPEISRLNNSRPLENPLLVKVIDSVNSEIDIFWPGMGKEVKTGTCPSSSIGNIENPAFTMFQTSGNREIETSHIFENRIWKNLKGDEKAIVLYHHSHLLNGFTSCFPFMLTENDWVSNWTPLNWMNHFIARYPEAEKEMNLILFDFRPEGSFKFSERQIDRYPNEAFGVLLKPFGNTLLETGLDAFLPSALLTSYHNGQHRSKLTLPESATGIIMSGIEFENFGLNENPSTYLPDYCLPLSKTK